MGAGDSWEGQLEVFCRRLLKSVPTDQMGDVHATIIAMTEAVLLRVALEESSGCQLSAARLLGLHRNTVRRKLAELRGEA